MELVAMDRARPNEMDAYERVLHDAMAGDATLFAREDYAEEAWRIVDPVLKANTPVYEYEPGTWGPAEVEPENRSRGRMERSCGPEAGGGSRSVTQTINIEVLDTAESVAQSAADVIAEEARKAVAARGRFVVAVSGGHTPWVMLRAFAKADVPWPAIHIVQVDERVAPAGHADRNLTHLRESLLDHAPLAAEQIHAMPVEFADLEAAAAKYAETLRQLAGSPPVLDLVHLGLGPDGHTASLVPGDPVLNVNDADVAITGTYQGRQRMTLTYPMINRSRKVLWVVTGAEKVPMLRRLLDGDESIPAGRIRREQCDCAGRRSRSGPDDRDKQKGSVTCALELQPIMVDLS